MRLFPKSCPNCGYHFHKGELRDSTKCLGLARKIVVCPGCGANLIWSKAAWNARALALVGFAVAATLIPNVFHWSDNIAIWAAFIIAPWSVALVVSLKMKLEPVAADDPAQQQPSALSSGCLMALKLFPWLLVIGFAMLCLTGWVTTELVWRSLGPGRHLPYFTRLILTPHGWLLFVPIPWIVYSAALSFRRKITAASLFLFAGTLILAAVIVTCLVVLALTLPLLPMRP